MLLSWLSHQPVAKKENHMLLVTKATVWPR